jgi:hypothetical protein
MIEHNKLKLNKHNSSVQLFLSFISQLKNIIVKYMYVCTDTMH